MKIKPVTEELKEALFKNHEICFRHHIEEIWGWNDAWQWENFCKEWDQGHWRVLLDGEKVIGYLCWAIEPDHLYLKNISLLPEYQGRGLGDVAMDFIEAQAAEKELAIKLSGFRTNQRVMSFYQRRGFNLIETVETGFRMSKGLGQLVSPETDDDWAEYHAIRERILFINRGRIGIYQNDHPDEYLENNHPKIYKLDGNTIGVVRIDMEEQEAGFRLVAILEEYQGKGYGSKLMRSAEIFALENSLTEELECLSLNAAQEAIGFYEKLGYIVDERKNWVEPEYPRMIKNVYSR